MTQPLPPPSIRSFSRLQVTDGLLVTAERWRRAHDYHRQRQNVHYQSINQPGIVCGLGVRLIPAPENIPGKYQDGRWVQIQPGIAIDLAGNPIVVTQPIDFRITTKPTNSTPLMVHLVLSYVDPETLHRSEPTEMVEETFRIDEKNGPPDELEVEVCRIRLHPGVVQLEYPIEVFFPGPNQLDFRYRQQAQARPEATVQVAQVVYSDPGCTHRTEQVTSLLAAIDALYPKLHAAPLGQVSLQHDPLLEATRYDLLFLTGQQGFSLPEAELHTLRTYLEAGGVLLVDVPPGGAELAKSMMDLARQVGTPLEYLERLDRHHPLRTQPFLFAALPQLHDQPIRVLTGGGIVMVIGGVSAAWGLDDALSLSRDTIRTAQEFGINLLHFAWKRRCWTQLMGAQATRSTQIGFQPKPSPLAELQSRPPASNSDAEKPTSTKVKDIFDQLLGN